MPLGIQFEASGRGLPQFQRFGIGTSVCLAGFFLAALLFSAPANPAPLPQEEKKTEASAQTFSTRKLILKDGSAQVVRSWEQKGNRVRYYSLERSAWEEIPADLVDFEATRKAEADQIQRLKEGEEKIRTGAQERLAGEVDVDASIEVAPGVFLPEEEGLFVIQCPTSPTGPGAAKPEGGSQSFPATGASPCTVATLTQVNADVSLDKKRLLAQILTPIPVVPGRHKVQVAGKQAVFRLATTQPEFYIRTSDDREPEMELIRAKVVGEKREIEFISTLITGEQYSQRKTLSIERWKVAKGVYRLTMSQTLEPGEYVLAEFLPGEGMNLYVWDFGVDASGAPAVATKTKKQ